MGCRGTKDAHKTSANGAIHEIENMIFALLKDNFCASGAEASLFGTVLKDEMLVKLQAKRKKIEVTESELAAQDPADYFINKVALVDPVGGEIVIPFDRVKAACSKFEPDELYMLYERLRHVKVARLREAHGNDIVSIVDDDGGVMYSDCRSIERRGAERRGRPVSAAAADQAPSDQEASGQAVFDVRNLRLT